MLFPLKSDLDEEEELESISGAKVVRWATFIVAGVLWAVAGNGTKTNDHCGTFSRVKVCLNVLAHGLMGVDGKSYAGKVFRRIVHNSCNRPLCCECYISWASRTARKMAFILGEASKRFGKVEHIVCSVAVKDYYLTIQELRRKAQKVLYSRGVIGGSLIFHGARFNRIKGWYWSPHFHVLGFVLNGYRCRSCERKSNCLEGCGGLDDANWQRFQVDRWYGKVADPLHERRNVRKTAAYELGHCTIPVDAKHFRVVTYFGVCSYRKLKISEAVRKEWEEKFKDKCPLCGDELRDGKYCGVKPMVTDRRNPDFKRDSVEDFLENGLPAWFVREEG